MWDNSQYTPMTECTDCIWQRTLFFNFINDISAREGEYKQTGTDKNVDFKIVLDFIEIDQKKQSDVTEKTNCYPIGPYLWQMPLHGICHRPPVNIYATFWLWLKNLHQKLHSTRSSLVSMAVVALCCRDACKQQPLEDLFATITVIPECFGI